jgi:hypothetical protein
LDLIHKFDKTALHYACSYPKPPLDDECKAATKIFEKLFERAKVEESTLEVSTLETISSIEFTQQHKILAYLLQPDRKGWCAIHLAAKSDYLKSLLDQAKRAGIKGDHATVSNFMQSFIDDVKRYASTEEDSHSGRSYPTQEMETICGGMLAKTQLSPIHIAISNGNSDAVEVLLKNPITATLLSKQKNTMVLIKPRYTALDLAIKVSRLQVQ